MNLSKSGPNVKLHPWCASMKSLRLPARLPIRDPAEYSKLHGRQPDSNGHTPTTPSNGLHRQKSILGILYPNSRFPAVGPERPVT